MTNEEEILDMFKGKGVLRVKDVREKGINPEYLRRLCKKGKVQRLSRGLYICPDIEISANIGLAQVAEWVPHE
jgi:predicted transcriptional regulator of viral defense system